MQCPYCDNEMQKGEVEVRDTSSLLGGLLHIGAAVEWLPEGERKKFFRKNTVNLALVAEGYYCQKCGKTIAIFDERGADFWQ